MTLLMFAMPPNMPGECDGIQSGGRGWCGVMYGWQLGVDPKPVCCTLRPYKSQFGHMRIARTDAAAAPDVRFWLNLCGACASGVCECVCVCVARSRFAVIDTRLRHAPRTSAQGRRLRKMQNKRKGAKNKTKNQIEFSLDREWATPDYALLKTINRFDIEREQRGDQKIQRYIALHCSAQLNATWPSNWNTAG